VMSSPRRQKEAGLAAHPARPVEGYPAARHNHMDVRVVGHSRAPAVEHRGGADASAEVLGIDGVQGSGGRQGSGGQLGDVAETDQKLQRVLRFGWEASEPRTGV
jgi:hypothetical protein